MWQTKHGDKPRPAKVEGEKIAEGDLLGNFVRRTDDTFENVNDRSLIGEDIGDDDEEEDEKDDKR